MITDQVREDFFHKEVPFGSVIYKEARKNNLRPELVAAVVQAESRFKPTARSGIGAIGLMQLVPRTGRWMGARDLTNPAQNIAAGAKYLKYLNERFDGNETKVIAAYNAGRRQREASSTACRHSARRGRTSTRCGPTSRTSRIASTATSRMPERLPRPRRWRWRGSRRYSLLRCSQSRMARPGERSSRRGRSRMLESRSANPHEKSVTAAMVSNCESVCRCSSEKQRHRLRAPRPLTDLRPSTDLDRGTRSPH